MCRTQVPVNALTVQVDFRQFDFSGYATTRELAQFSTNLDGGAWLSLK